MAKSESSYTALTYLLIGAESFFLLVPDSAIGPEEQKVLEDADGTMFNVSEMSEEEWYASNRIYESLGKEHHDPVDGWKGKWEEFIVSREPFSEAIDSKGPHKVSQFIFCGGYV